MDLNDRIAARRAELAREAAEEKAALRLVEERRREQEQAAAEAAEVERREALDEAAVALTATGAPVVRDGDTLALAPTKPDFDSAALRQSQIERLLQREARRRFTPGENWQVIGSIVGGLLTIHLAGLGLAVLLFGFWRRKVLLDRRRVELRAAYPDLFGPPPPQVEGEPAAEPSTMQKLWWNPHAKP